MCKIFEGIAAFAERAQQLQDEIDERLDWLVARQGDYLRQPVTPLRSGSFILGKVMVLSHMQSALFQWSEAETPELKNGIVKELEHFAGLAVSKAKPDDAFRFKLARREIAKWERREAALG